MDFVKKILHQISRKSEACHRLRLMRTTTCRTHGPMWGG